MLLIKKRRSNRSKIMFEFLKKSRRNLKPRIFFITGAQVDKGLIFPAPCLPTPHEFSPSLGLTTVF